MNNSDTPYDVVVLGNGPTGMASAALLAKQKIRTLLISNVKEYGKYEYPFYHMDAIEGSLGEVIRELELQLEVKPVSLVDRSIFPCHHVPRPRSLVAYHTELRELFPEARDALADYFQVIEGLGKEWVGLMQGDLGYTLRDIPFCIRYSRTSYRAFVQDMFANYPALGGILCAALPTSDVALTVMAGFIYAQIFGSCTVRGGMPEIRKQLLATLDNMCVEQIETAEPITLKDLEAEGVWVKAGLQTYHTRLVLDTSTDEKLKPHDQSSLSVFSLLVEMPTDGVELPAEEVWYVYPDYDVPRLLEQVEEGKDSDRFPLLIWNASDRQGEFNRDSAMIRVDVPINGRLTIPDNFAERVWAKAQACFSGLDSRGLIRQVITPHDHEEATGLRFGAGYGWAANVRQVMKNPVSMYKNRYYFNTSHWGFAWFSAALKATNQIATKLTNRQQA